MTIRGTAGSYWKFTWMDKGVEQEAIDLLFVSADPGGPAVLRAVHDRADKHVDQMRPIFDEDGGDLRHGAG